MAATKGQRLGQLAFLLLGIAFAYFISRQEPAVPRSPRILQAEQRAEKQHSRTPPDPRIKFIKQLSTEPFHDQTFPFPLVVQAVSGKNVHPLDAENPVHSEVLELVNQALTSTRAELNRPDSKTRSASRINEVSRLFEDSLLQKLQDRPELDCEVPERSDGRKQRSGYPDLLVRHRLSGAIFYVDPKLVGSDGLESSLRSFYFSPRHKTSKIQFDAVHLVLGIIHNDDPTDRQFTKQIIKDLSTLDLSLKTEFNASNRDLYSGQGDNLGE